MTDYIKNGKEGRCPKCNSPLEERPRMYATRDGRFFSGLVCIPCNSLSPQGGGWESFLVHHRLLQLLTNS